MRCRTVKFAAVTAAAALGLGFLASCEFPQSVRVKASPTIQIPVPLGKGADNSFIRSYISVEGIKEQLKGEGGEGKTPAVYKYDMDEPGMTSLGIDREGGSFVQTYLITYPLFDMSLDFNEYLNTPGAGRVPPVEITAPIASAADAAMRDNPGGLPFDKWVRFRPITVDLGDMKNLVSDVTFKPSTSFIITVPPAANAEEMKKAVRIRVPQLKIGGDTDVESSWKEGELNAGKTELVFKSSITDDTVPLLLTGSIPGSDTVTIEVRLANKITAGKYGTKLNFDWNTAKVTPKDNASKNGTFEGFNLRSYLDNLGSGAEFENIPAYFHVKAVEGFSAAINGLSEANPAFPIDVTKIVDGGGELTAAWFSEAKKYDFTGTLNNGKALNYTITFPASVDITNDDTSKKKKITATLAVLLPMSFKLAPAAGKEITIADGDYKGKYFPVKFKGLDDFLGNGEDGGVMGEIGDKLGEGDVIRGLRLKLSDIKNDVTSPIFLAVNTDTAAGKWELAEIADGAADRFIDMKAESLAGIPPVKFAVKEESGSGRLYIKSQSAEPPEDPAFRIKISVIADVNIDKSLDL